MNAHVCTWWWPKSFITPKNVICIQKQITSHGREQQHVFPFDGCTWFSIKKSKKKRFPCALQQIKRPTLQFPEQASKRVYVCVYVHALAAEESTSSGAIQQSQRERDTCLIRTCSVPRTPKRPTANPTRLDEPATWHTHLAVVCVLAVQEKCVWAQPHPCCSRKNKKTRTTRILKRGFAEFSYLINVLWIVNGIKTIT